MADELRSFRVTLTGPLIEVWKICAHDEEDAIHRVRHGDGFWVEANWDGEPDGSAVADPGEPDEASCCACDGAHPCGNCPVDAPGAS